MELIEFVLLGIGLAMDAFAVAVGMGATMRKMRIRHALVIALYFGFFQALMPFIGWCIGSAAKGYIGEYDHWVAFGLLAFIGGRMIYKAVIPHVHPEQNEDENPLNLYLLFVLAIATSIDALAVGVTFSFRNVVIWQPVGIIGLITFAMSYAGTYLGCTVGKKFNEHALEITGGAILIGIGLKILLSHLFW